jgi:hypothetical protein
VETTTRRLISPTSLSAVGSASSRSIRWSKRRPRRDGAAAGIVHEGPLSHATEERALAEAWKTLNGYVVRSG